jgi:NAD(P)-dependent dehydrogenase (short-subunit alcohol dehydrogenase family)
MSDKQHGTRKVALVMGGTSGIGLAAATALIETGNVVIVTGRDPAKGRRAAEALGADASYVPADVADASQVAAAVSATVARWGRLDWAVNAAALADLRPAKLAEITETEWDRTLAADLKGVWLCMKFEIEAMLAAGGGGAIVNVSSVNGLSGTPTAAAYCAAKHGMHGLSKTAATEYAPQGIRINVVCPGAHRTPMLAGVWEHVAPGDPARAEAMMCTQIPLGRIGEPSECAQAIAWLLSGSASYVTGAILTVDGAMAAS